MDYKILGQMNRRLNSLALKEVPFDYDDTALRDLLSSGLSTRDATIAALEARIVRLEGLVSAHNTLFQQLADNNTGGIIIMGNNVVTDDGVA